jgi:hypothetical protein
VAVDKQTFVLASKKEEKKNFFKENPEVKVEVKVEVFCGFKFHYIITHIQPLSGVISY